MSMLLINVIIMVGFYLTNLKKEAGNHNPVK